MKDRLYFSVSITLIGAFLVYLGAITGVGLLIAFGGILALLGVGGFCPL